MTNFKEETLTAIKKSGHKEEDVLFIGSSDGKKRINLKKFKEISNFEYDSGYGAAEIYPNLIVYFKDKLYITRGEYDGSEWWEYDSPLNYTKDDDYTEFDEIKCGMWNKLE